MKFSFQFLLFSVLSYVLSKKTSLDSKSTLQQKLDIQLVNQIQTIKESLTNLNQRSKRNHKKKRVKHEDLDITQMLDKELNEEISQLQKPLKKKKHRFMKSKKQENIQKEYLVDDINDMFAKSDSHKHKNDQIDEKSLQELRENNASIQRLQKQQQDVDNFSQSQQEEEDLKNFSQTQQKELNFNESSQSQLEEDASQSKQEQDQASLENELGNTLQKQENDQQNSLQIQQKDQNNIQQQQDSDNSQQQQVDDEKAPLDLNHLTDDQKQHELFKQKWSEYSVANMTAQLMIEKIKPQIMNSLHLEEMPKLQGKKIKERNFQDQQEVQLEIQMGNSVITANVVDPYTDPTVISAQYITNVSDQKYEEPNKLESNVQELIQKQVKQKVEDELDKKFQKFNLIMFRTGQAKFLNDNHKKFYGHKDTQYQIQQQITQFKSFNDYIKNQYIQKKSKNQTIYDAIIDADFGQKLEIQFDVEQLNGKFSVELKNVSTPNVALVETFQPSELGENWNEPVKVKQISSYAKEQIKEFKDNAHILKGQLLQPFYLANGMIFDDDPTIMEQMVEPDWTQSNTAYHNNSEEYHALWDHKDQSENGFHPVKYKSQETMYDPEDIILNYDTGITLKKDNSQITTDEFTNIPNPIKSRQYQSVTNREVIPNPTEPKSKKHLRFQKRNLKNVANKLDSILQKLRRRR